MSMSCSTSQASSPSAQYAVADCRISSDAAPVHDLGLAVDGLAADAALRLAEVALDEGLGRRRERRQRGEGQGHEFLHGAAPDNVVGPDSA